MVTLARFCHVRVRAGTGQVECSAERGSSSGNRQTCGFLARPTTKTRPHVQHRTSLCDGPAAAKADTPRVDDACRPSCLCMLRSQAVPGAGAVVAQQHQQPLAEHLALAAAAGASSQQTIGCAVPVLCGGELRNVVCSDNPCMASVLSRCRLMSCTASSALPSVLVSCTVFEARLSP